MKWLHRLGDGLEAATLGLLALMMAAMAVVVFCQVAARLTTGSIPWSEELARYLMIYMTYVGASVGVKRKSHIAITFLADRLPRRPGLLVELAGDLLCLVLCALLLRYGWRLVVLTMPQKTPAMRIPMGTAYFSVVLGALLMAVHFLTHAADSALGLLHGGEVEP